MDNSTSTPLEGVVLLLNQLDLVSTSTVGGILYGIAFTLFCLYVYSLVPRFREKDRSRQAKFMLAYSAFIMLCGLCYLLSNAWANQDAYVKHSNYLGGPYFYLLSLYRGGPVILLALTCQVIIDTLTLTIQIWRVWVIWSATRYANVVIVLPIMSFLAFMGTRLRTIIVETTLPSAQALKVDPRVELAANGLQGGTTILCTALISGCLIFKQWQQRKLIGRTQGSTGYMNVVALLIESYALESIWLLMIIALWWIAPGIFFNETLLYIEIIAYILVQYRVAGGTAVESQRGQTNMSSLHWNHSFHATTHFSEAGEMQTGPNIFATPEVTKVPHVSGMV